MRSASDDVGERVHEAVDRLPEPWPPDRVAAMAGTDSQTARHYLDAMYEAGEVIGCFRGGVPVYYPDPVRSYVQATREALDLRDDVLAERVASIRSALAGWQDPEALQTPTELLAYHHAGRLVSSSRLPVGTNAFAHEWDVLVVLDTCRVDALRAAADRLQEAVGDGQLSIESRLSPGSQTAEWLCQTFTTDHRDEVGRTGYVSGNGWTKGVFEDGMRPDDDAWFDGVGPPTEWDVVGEDDLGALVHAWTRDRGTYSREVPWEPHPAPRTVTDHAIALARQRTDLDRLVVHYKQPHAPYTAAAEREGRSELTTVERAPFDYIEQGGAREDVWTAYLTDLRAAVDEVVALCRNVDGRVVVTADHGEAFGERGEFGHRPAMLHPDVKQVPWTVVSGTDERTREPDLSVYEETETDLDAHLEALGYR